MPRRFGPPDGWVFQAFSFASTRPTSSRLIARFFGARRKAYNWTSSRSRPASSLPRHRRRVEASLSLRAAQAVERREVGRLREHRDRRGLVARGLEGGLCQRDRGAVDGLLALAGVASRGRSPAAGSAFPAYKKRGKDRDRFSFTTGAMRLEPDRRHLTMPVLGTAPHAREHPQIERLVTSGRAQGPRGHALAPRHEDRRRGQGRRLPAPAPGRRGAFLGRRRRRRHAQVGDGRRQPSR